MNVSEIQEVEVRERHPGLKHTRIRSKERPKLIGDFMVEANHCRHYSHKLSTPSSQEIQIIVWLYPFLCTHTSQSKDNWHIRFSVGTALF